MGDPFLRTYYSIYDMDNKKLGLVGIAETTRSKNEIVKEEADANGSGTGSGDGIGKEVPQIVKDVLDDLGIDSEDDQ